jgi:hypothetical protein
MFSMVQHHKYSLTEIENMIPFERDLYVTMLVQYLQEIEAQQKRQEING